MNKLFYKAFRGSRSKNGFTLTEVMVATGLFGIVSAGVFHAFSASGLQTRAGQSQVHFANEGRIAAQVIATYIEKGKAASASTNGISIVLPDYVLAQIRFEDGDGLIETVEDNRLVYDPDVDEDGAVEELCRYVSPIAGEEMFRASSPGSVGLSFHVGDGTDPSYTSFSGSGSGYQGIEIRMSATPRNMQRWHD